MRTTLYLSIAFFLLVSRGTAQAEETPASTSQPSETTSSASPPVTVMRSGAPMIVIGLGAGAYIPTSKLKTNFLVGIDGAYQLPFLNRQLGVGLGLAYSQPTTSGDIQDPRVPVPTASYSSTMQELMLDLLMSYRILKWESVWSPHAGIGPAFYFLSHKVKSLELEQTETSTQVGFLFTAGADYRLWRGALTGEVRIPFATVGQRTTGDSNVGAVSIFIGYRFRI
jgi:hypothetical protein